MDLKGAKLPCSESDWGERLWKSEVPCWLGMGRNVWSQTYERGESKGLEDGNFYFKGVDVFLP